MCENLQLKRWWGRHIDLNNVGNESMTNGKKLHVSTATVTPFSVNIWVKKFDAVIYTYWNGTIK